ncbi:MAG: amidohydrolase, partial [Pseudomonadota bacterium]
MIIDCHVHLMPKRVREDRSPFCERDAGFCAVYKSEKSRLASESDIIDYMDRSDIAKAVVFGFPWEDPTLIAVNNDEVWEFHERFPDRIIPFAVLSPDLDAAMVDEALRTLNGGFAGVGELAAYHDGWTRDNLARLDPVCR